MARTPKQANTESAPKGAAGYAVEEPPTAPAVPAPAPRRLRALAHIRRMGGNVTPGTLFTPTGDKEFRWLLDGGHAELE